ncbi:positive regulation of histone H3-K4 trimethylation [Homalodisca vitripennis]|nr:positive regulation of histone H3-K4 trimethylation [Homalodisca vitripennis]
MYNTNIKFYKLPLEPGLTAHRLQLVSRPRPRLLTADNQPTESNTHVSVVVRAGLVGRRLEIPASDNDENLEKRALRLNFGFRETFVNFYSVPGIFCRDGSFPILDIGALSTQFRYQQKDTKIKTMELEIGNSDKSSQNFSHIVSDKMLEHAALWHFLQIQLYVLQDHNYGAPPPPTPASPPKPLVNGVSTANGLARGQSPASQPPNYGNNTFGANRVSKSVQPPTTPTIFNSTTMSNVFGIGTRLQTTVAPAEESDVESSDNEREPDPQGEETETANEGEENEDDSITRCICDFQHDDGYMICCDKCSGFSVNKQCIVENLKEESLVALRKVCDGVSAAGGLEAMEITNELVHAAKNSHAHYSEHLAKQREEMKDKINSEKERKQAAIEKKELEAQKFQVLSDARKRAAELDDKIQELSKKCKSVWQHVDCMGIDRTNIPDEYQCEKCQPRRIDKQKAIALQMRKKKELLDTSDSSSDTSSSSDTNVPVRKPNLPVNNRRRSEPAQRKNSTSGNKQRRESAKEVHSSARNNRQTFRKKQAEKKPPVRRKEEVPVMRMFEFLEHVSGAVDGSRYTIGVFCDLSKTFDCVNLDILVG